MEGGREGGRGKDEKVKRILSNRGIQLSIKEIHFQLVVTKEQEAGELPEDTKVQVCMHPIHIIMPQGKTNVAIFRHH